MSLSWGSQDLFEFAKTLPWYTRRKLTVAGQIFETGKGIVVEILKARRGTYQKPFLHVGMVFLFIAVAMAAPLIVSSYPTSTSSGQVLSATPPSAVLNQTIAIESLETTTLESQKPRRDVVEYSVASGDTLSSIAEKFSSPGNKLGVDSLAHLNSISVKKVLKPGDLIKIPPVSGIIVKVKSGDTIQSLAKRYGLASAQPVVDWPYNSFVNDETFALAVGQTLVIPGGRPPQEAPPTLRVVQTPLFAAAPLTGGGQFSWPTGGAITQYFAWYHRGVDIANAVGTTVFAADSGRVTSVQYLPYGYGHHVILDHGNGFRTLYGHLSHIDVSEGENVSRGQGIGAMGSTGRSSGSHLHFEVQGSGGATNPLDFLR